MTRQSGGLQLASLTSVWPSLTPNAKRVILVFNFVIKYLSFMDIIINRYSWWLCDTKWTIQNPAKPTIQGLVLWSSTGFAGLPVKSFIHETFGGFH